MSSDKILTGTAIRRKRQRDDVWNSSSEDEQEYDQPTSIEIVDSPVTTDVKEGSVESEPAPDADVSSKEDKLQDSTQLRFQSRATYLKKRHETKLTELEKELEELDQLVQTKGYSALTSKERKDYEYKKELLDISKQRANIDKSDAYQLPQDYITSSGKIDRKRKESVLHSKYQEGKDDESYEKGWENEQLRKAQKTQIALNNVDDINLPAQSKYEYVFDQSQFIGFVADDTLDGEGDLISTPETQPKRHKSTLQDVRRSLPVYNYRDQFLDAVKENQILIVIGETGSGKTTQLPQYLHEAGYSDNGRMIACTQPRRVAATSVANRVADEMGVRIGQEVGYSIRFENKSTDKTIVKYLTDGMLLREFLNDPQLSQYGAIMIDEAHERTTSTEILLSLLKDVTKIRPDLRLIIASATMNAQKFSDFFGEAPLFNIPGRRFPIDIIYSPQPEANYKQAAISTILQIHVTEGPGDILVFLTGQDDIEYVNDSLQQSKSKLGTGVKNLIICQIYANLPPDLQAKIFEPTPPNSRKVVLATNIAETSITIDGIKYVVDPGYVKENQYDPATGMESLVRVSSSKASAQQRAGRAGRVGPGKCYRLYTKWAFYNELQGNPTPEILRTNLASVVLLLLSLGIKDVFNFNYLDRPNEATFMNSLTLLYALGAITKDGDLSELGRKMANFPIDPMQSKVLITSEKYKVTSEVLSIIAMVSESSSLFYRPKDKKEQADRAKNQFKKLEGDQLTLLEVWEQWVDTGYSSQWCKDYFLQYKTMKRARDVREQLEKLCDKTGILTSSTESLSQNQRTINIQKAITSGYFQNAAKLSKMGDSYRAIKKNQTVFIHPSSMLYSVKPPPKLVLYNELVLTSKEFMRNCMLIDEKWLRELAPHYFGKDLLEDGNKTGSKR